MSSLAPLPVAPCITQPDLYDDPERQQKARDLCLTRCPRLTQCEQETAALERTFGRMPGVVAGRLPDERTGKSGQQRRRRGPAASAPCGTASARRRHRVNAETCDVCNPPGIVRQPNQYATLQPCGTYAAARRHERDHEPLCDPCRAARLAYRATPAPPVPLQPCGTVAAARRHERADEPLCPPCRHARSERRTSMRRARAQADHLAVELAVEGEPMPLNRRERHAVMDELTARGRSASEIAERVGTSQRAVVRERSRVREASEARTA